MRLFAAIYPPREAVEAALRALGSVAGLPGKPAPIEAVHLTLLFIGEVDRRQLKDVTESVERSAAGIARGTLRLHRLVNWPTEQDARMAVVLADASAEVLEIQRRLAKRLARHPRAKGGDRFTPHLTLQRYPHGSKPPDLDVPLEPVEVPVTEVVLVESILSAAGARHVALERFELGV